MIDLRFKADFSWNGPPVVLTLASLTQTGRARGLFRKNRDNVSGVFLSERVWIVLLTPEQADSLMGTLFLHPAKVVLRGCSGQTPVQLAHANRTVRSVLLDV